MFGALVPAVAACLLLTTQAYIAKDGEVVIPGADSYNGLNLVPQMGWNNWNAYECDVSEDLVLSTARKMVDYGLRDLGYKYVVLDDCWTIGRNASGYLQHDYEKFPKGIRHMADRIHDMGMWYGAYSSAGGYTCAHYPGSLSYETEDARYFAENHVDYLKYDNCDNRGQSGTPQISFDRYNVMSKALNATGRKIVYAMCSWGNDNPYDWAYGIANSGRMSGDIISSFNRPDSACPCTETPCEWPGFHCSIMNIINKMAPIVSRTRSGYFNDMDMLEVGNYGINDHEAVSHFSMWSILSSPLLIGTNLIKLKPRDLAILSNPAVIALNQDPSATAAFRIWRHECADRDRYGQCERSLWSRELDNGDFAIALLNGGDTTTKMSASLEDVFLFQSIAGSSSPAEQLSYTWDVHDLWAWRMSEDEAKGVINGTAQAVKDHRNGTTRYNATATSYEDGIKANATALFGKKVGEVKPQGTWTAEVARHSVGLYRLRAQPKSMMQERDEL
ncbi:MAG: hypothetical protein M1831_003484 [Alyxoria varia]|nr:MAG: hypothetical protein M1831_003484 [Alyxoria varia]